MIIKYLKLKNFRNYDYLDINFSENKNIIFGNNAQGKTNILEAIYIVSNGKSIKNNKDKELIKFDCEDAHINSNINNNEIDIHFHKDKNKGIAINKEKIKKISDFLNLSNVILFSPEDLNIIKNGPSERRKFLDLEICPLSKNYVFNLIKYNKLLKQRNDLLNKLNYELKYNNDDKKKNEYLNLIYVWNEELLKYGIEIIREREKFIDNIKKYVLSISEKITNYKEKVEIYYEKNVSIENYKKELENSLQTDIKTKITNIGPHRDDIKFQVNNIDLRKFGSQGQQRTAALSLKLSEIETVKNIIKDTPILLLDDVFSELDEERQQFLVNSLDGIQTIITATGIKNNIFTKLNAQSIFEVKNNKIIKHK